MTREGAHQPVRPRVFVNIQGHLTPAEEARVTRRASSPSAANKWRSGATARCDAVCGSTSRGISSGDGGRSVERGQATAEKRARAAGSVSDATSVSTLLGARAATQL